MASAFVLLDFDAPVPWARCFSDFLGVCSSLAPVSSSFSSVSTRCVCFCFLFESHCSKFIHQIMNYLSAGNSFITKFTSKFSPTHSSRSVFHMGDTEIHVVLKYTTPWCTTLLTNCNWKQMANGVDNCCLLLTNHKLPCMNRTAFCET
jgi:hypothetical protein